MVEIPKFLKRNQSIKMVTNSDLEDEILGFMRAVAEAERERLDREAMEGAAS